MHKGNMDSKLPVVVFVIVVRSAWEVHAAVANCTALAAAGRVADTSDPTCKNYTYCVYNNAAGAYLSYYYSCPTTSFFNPNTQRCTTNYTCNNTSNDEPVSDCVDEGFFEDESSTDCTSFIGCVALDGIFIETKYTCAAGTYFDPSVGDCTFEYVCPSMCTAAGRFPNTKDTTCKMFYSCVLAPNGSFVQTEYTCPSTSLFNPTTKVCSTTYKCK